MAALEPLAITIDTSQADQAIDALTAKADTLIEKLERIKAFSPESARVFIDQPSPAQIGEALQFYYDRMGRVIPPHKAE
ncbi:hypothetical protein [Hymenobacter mucosus]|uniref:Uncharacterized protein n=1 Tax=Hymenobacter mucosus TaxID=1411120 RepID=A0A239ABD5_9BACT|nr:hypothetical protein [Hymenobacter mucosus]SNR92368.1 hypothetical protein SAMN06269173_11194 [Hymenobacter mucosus]